MDSIVDEEKKEVAFLYRLTKGDCPRSYGLHVANMACTSSFLSFLSTSFLLMNFAAIPKSILDEAQSIADTLHSSILHKLTNRVCEAINNSNSSEEQKHEALVGLWRAAKGRWISWDET